jgi:cytochrome P450
MTTLEEWFLSDPLWAAVVALSAAYVLFIATQNSSGSGNAKKTDGSIPWAPGGIPILGHALSYRQDPSGFLLRTSQTVGSMFQLNLAGKHMIVVAGPDAQRQVAMAPERILSARQAVADIGFEETLGTLNVHQGTDLHKGIVKGVWQRNPAEQFLGWRTALQKALQLEIFGTVDGDAVGDRTTTNVELFQLVRRVVLRATVDRMIGPKFLDGTQDDVFLKEFMAFQDQLEDVTAKAVVLPRWFALPALLWPVRKQRETLQGRIVERLNGILLTDTDGEGSTTTQGFWLAQMYPRYSITDIAEYIVGLLFAAHKNPAIGAAQAYLMLYEQCSETDRQEVANDAKKLLSYSRETAGGEEGWNSKSTSSLRLLCLETLRLTAHSIGAVRTVQEDFTIGVAAAADDEDNGVSKNNTQSYVIPKGASIALTHITPNLNPQSWGEKASQMDLKAHSAFSYQDEYRFTTFSHGVHKCPGQQLAVVILQCTVALLLEDYEITLPSKIPPLSFERATLAQREGPVLVQIQRRNESSTK